MKMTTADEKQPCGLETVTVGRRARAQSRLTVLGPPYKVAQSFPTALEAGMPRLGVGCRLAC